MPTAGSREQIAQFASPEPDEWRKWLNQAIRDWRDEWLPVLENPRSAGTPAPPLKCGARRIWRPAFDDKRKARRMLLKIHCRKTCAARPPLKFWNKSLPPTATGRQRQKSALRKPLEEFFADAAFLLRSCRRQNGRDPLAEDWDWVRGHMTALLRLAQEFAENSPSANAPTACWISTTWNSSR